MTPRLPLALLGLALLADPAAAQEDPTDPAVDRLARAALPAWRVPGLAVVVVRDDRVVCLAGYGVRDLGRPAPVGPDTVFPLASCTKPFTTLLLAMLADDDVLDWDDKVRRHLPAFRLADPLADAGATLRDLVTHRTGVGNHDPLWWYAPWPLAERVRRVGLAAPAHGFRARFEYQAIVFGAAGLAAEQAAGAPWADLVRDRVLQPLAMKTASPAFPPDSAGRALAGPHRKDEGGTVRRIDRYPLAEADPAGSLHASARDLAAFLRFQLGDGRWAGRRLVTARRLREPQAPQVVIPQGDFTRVMNPETKFLTYGLGWIVQDYRGRQLLMHGGAIDGFRAHFTLVPDARLGIALLNNLDGSFLNLALSNALVDHYLGLPPRDWSAYYRKVQADEEKLKWDGVRRLRAQKSGRPPARPLAAYAGAYEDPAYGPCRVAVEDGALVWHWGRFRSALDPVQGDAFLADQEPLVAVPVTFDAAADGPATALRAFGRTFARKK